VNKINLLDLFSGIGGFAQGLTQAGFEIENHYFSEIEKHPIAIYRNKFKEAQYAGSVTDVRGDRLPKINAITFGSPCQDFSLAGKREGIEGERSSLVREAIRLIDECRPDFFIWENVKGVFSSNDGADFWAVVKAIADIGVYRIEWQLLNTSWFLPQNRERVYLVGSLGAGSGRAVFPIEPKSSGADERAEQATNVRTLTVGGNSGGMHSSMTLIAAQRGRNPERPSDGTKGAPMRQTLEINHNGTTNTLTSVAKDNYVIGTRIHGWRENQNTISAFRGDARRSGVGEHVYHKETGIANTLQTAHTHKLINSVAKDNYVLNTPYSMGSAKPNRSTIGCRAPEVGTSESSIRRLTEVECERLQGFSDGWTEYGDYEGVIKKVPATARYKALGNAVTVDVVQSVGESILEATA